MKRDKSFVNRPRARADLVLSETRKDGIVEHYVLMDCAADMSFLLRPVEYKIFSLLDGTRDIGDIESTVREEYPSLSLDDHSIHRFVNELRTKGLLDECRGNLRVDGKEMARHKPWFIYYKLPLFRFDAFINDRVVDSFRRRWAPIIIGLGGVFVLPVLIERSLSGYAFLQWTNTLQDFRLIASKNAGYLYGALLLSAIMHEFGHGMALKLFGGQVGEIGIIFFFCQPLFYCNTNGAWLLTEKIKRAVVSGAGMIADLTVSLFLFILYFLTSLYSVRLDFVLCISLLMIGKIAVNLIPFFRLDGYFVLSDLVGEHNLMKHSLFYAFRRLKRLPATRDELSRSTLYLSYCVICGVSFVILSVVIFFCGRETLTAVTRSSALLSGILPLAFVVPLAVFLIATIKKYWTEFRLVNSDGLYRDYRT